MKRCLNQTLSIAILSLVFASCSNKAPKESRLIPKEAVVVVSIDPETLKNKLQHGGISIDSIWANAFEKDSTSKEDQQKITNLRNAAGINWKEKIHFFTFLQKENKKGNVYNLLFSLTDSAAFYKYVNDLKWEGKPAIEKKKEFDYLNISSDKILAWNDKNAVVLLYENKIIPYYDTVNMRFVIPEKKDNKKQILEEITRLFTQKESESLASVKEFGKLFAEKAEGYLFASSASTMNALSGMPLQLPKLEELISNNYTTATLRFEEGKIIAKSVTHTNPFLSSILKKYAGPTVNTSLIDQYPSQNINAIILASFNPQIFGGVLKELEVESLLNQFLTKSGISSAEIYGAIKGDIAVVISDLGIGTNEPDKRKDELAMIKMKPTGKMILNIPAGNKDNFLKLLNKIADKGYIRKVGSEYKSAELFGQMGIYLVANDQGIIIASDSLTYTQYKMGGNKSTIKKEALDHFKGKSTIMYIDIANTLNGFLKDSSAGYNNSMSSAKNTIKDIVGTSDNYSDNKIISVLEINMQNQKQNSLVTLVSLLTNIAVDTRYIAKREKELEEKLFPSSIPTVIRAN